MRPNPISTGGRWPCAAILAFAGLCPVPWLSSALGDTAAFSGPAFLEHVRYLASDELEGRGLGSRGIDLAAEYIAAQFKAAGLKPGGDDGTYFQWFEATLRRDLSPDTRLEFAGVAGLESPKLGADFVPMSFSGAGDFAGPVVFAGYGISAAEFNYDDYRDLEVKGKVLLVLRFEPHDENPEAKFGGGVYSQHSYHNTKVALAKAKGAAALLVVAPPLHRTEPDNLADFAAGNTRENYGLPCLQISQELADKLLAAGGLGSLESLQKQLDEKRQCLSAELKEVTARGEVKITRVRAPARNVVGIVDGAAEQASEYVVIGAHYDHLGKARYSLPRSDQERADQTPHIHNGADDNASGTAGLIELARRFASADPPKRSVVFAAFSGEESGLLGSEHFAGHPPVPLSEVAAMLNLDMIGSLQNDQLTVFGIGTGQEFEDLLGRLAGSCGLRIKGDQAGIGPSDHTPFYAAGVPVLHFFTGSHDRYHRPEDDTPYVNAEGGAKVTGLVCAVAAELAAAERRPTYQKVEQPPVARGGLKVRMGVMPSYADDDEPGMRITGVSGGGPAEKAGLLAGDRILMIGPATVNNVYDYMGALSRYNPGDVVDLTVRRDGRDLRVPVTLGAAR